MSRVTQKRRFHLFLLIAILLVMQVGWWAYLFIRNAKELEVARLENPTISLSAEQITAKTFHNKVMFLSESGFFLFMTGVGLFLLYRAFRFDEKAHESQKNFIEILAHESKTPLTALKLRLEALLDSESSASTRNELKAGLEEIRRLTSIVEKTLKLNRMERQVLVREPVCISEILTDLVRRLEPFFKDRGVACQLNITTRACAVGDVDGLRSSFQSVIENAVLYNDRAEKTLVIGVREEANRLIVCFEDNGPGISDADRSKIFEKFYRGKSRSKLPGTGLGLFIARTVVRAHHGVIEALPVSTGATFQIQLPVAT